MKLNALLEDEEPQQKLRKGALELQAYLLDLEHIDLDVELTGRDGYISVEYRDKNDLVHGKVQLETKLTLSGLLYKARTIDGLLYAQKDGLDATMILFHLFQKDIPFKPFEQAVMSAFGTTGVDAEDKARFTKDDEVFGVSLAPPFKLEGDRQASLMVHNQKVVQFLSVRITSASTVRVYIHDSNGDVNECEGPSIVSTFPKLRQFITAAQEAL